MYRFISVPGQSLAILHENHVQSWTFFPSATSICLCSSQHHKLVLIINSIDRFNCSNKRNFRVRALLWFTSRSKILVQSSNANSSILAFSYIADRLFNNVICCRTNDEDTSAVPVCWSIKSIASVNAVAASKYCPRKKIYGTNKKSNSKNKSGKWVLF